MSNPYTPPGSDGDLPPDFAGKGERPTSITVICVLMAIGAVATPFIAMMASTLKLPGWYTPFLLLSSVVGVASLVGLWTMKKWAVFLYTGMAAVSQIVMLAGGLWTPTSIIGPAIVIGIMFANLQKMT
jgi:hypothetical protein